MQNMNGAIKDKILQYLDSKGYGASSSEISKNIGHNRITVTKYLEIMHANNTVTVDDVAQAKLWRLKKANDKPKVLIVDDEPSVVDLVALSLIPGKYEVLKAYSGLDALDKVYQEVPDLMVLDLMMPGVDGYEVCKRVKNSSITQHIPVIILSAKGEIKDKLKGMDMGADDYITKPFDPMEMEARVDTVLRRSRKDIDMHPLSKLPGKLSCRERIQKNLSEKVDFKVYRFRLDNVDEYKRKFGYRKTNDTISLVARAFSEAIGDSQEAFLCHTISENFILITGDEDDIKKVREAFEKILPYIYSKGRGKNTLELVEKKIDMKNLKDKESEDILKVIEGV